MKDQPGCGENSSSSNASLCLSREELEPLAAGELTDERLERHVKTCAACREALERLRADHEFLKSFVGQRMGAPIANRAGTHWTQSHRVQVSSECTATVEGYEILSEIRRGGQGIVYEAVHKKTKRRVALKMLLEGRAASSRQRQHFEREIELVASLRHPHIVTLYDSGQTSDGSHYFAMEFVAGMPLDKYFESSTHARRDASDRLALFCKICDAVQHAHRHGVIHRDLKPGNILIDAQGEPHVLDFGVARALERDAGGVAGMVTRIGEFMGTFAYAAPEQVSGDPNQIDTRTDVYSLGVMLYELLTRAAPYPVDGALSDVIHNITKVEPQRPSMHSPAINDELDSIVLKALSKDRERRYQSAESLRKDISHFLAGEPIEAKHDSTWYMLTKAIRRYRGVVAIAASFVLLLTAFAITMVIQAQRIAAQRDTAQIANRRLTIQGGRMAGLAGDTARAEELLWEAQLSASAGEQAEDNFAQVGEAGPLDSYCALWELYARQPCLATWSAHEGGGTSVCFSPQRGILASCGNEGTVKLWEMPSGKLLRAIDAGNQRPRSVCFSPDGKLLAWGNRDGTIPLWNVQENQIEAVFTGHSDAVHSVAFNSVGDLLASGSWDRTVRLWNVETYQGSILGEHPREVNEVAFDKDGKILASIDYYGSVKFWDLPGGSWRETQEVRALYPIDYQSRHVGKCIHFAPNAARLAIAELDNQLIVWDILTGTERKLYAHKDYLLSVRFSPDGHWLASCSRDQTIILWNLERERIEHVYTGHGGGVTGITFGPDGRTIASCGGDGTIKLWEVPPHQHLRRFREHTDTVHCVQYSRDGRFLTSSGSDHRIHIRDASSGESVQELLGHTNTVAAVAFHPEGRQLASVGYDKTLKIWDLQNGTFIRSIKAHDDLVSTVAYSPDGQYLATGSGGDSEYTVKLWDAATADHLHTFDEHRVRVPCVCFSPNGKWLASCSTQNQLGNIYLHDMATKRSRALLEEGQGGNFRALAFSPNSRILASGNDEGIIELWDASTGKRLKSWEAHAENIFALNFHPDGRILASAARSEEIKLWDTAAASDHHLATFVGHEDIVFSVCFHPDGRTLASSSADKTVGLWDLTYYDRHIAGNLEYQISRLPLDGQGNPTIQRLRTWADSVLARP